MKKILKHLFPRKRRYNLDPSNQIFLGDKPVRNRLRHLHVYTAGKNNIIRLHPDTLSRAHITITITGDNNQIDIHSTLINRLDILMKESDNCRLTLGADTSCINANIVFAESDTALTIGEDCMLANADIRVSDGHTLYDMETGRVLNHAPKHMRIGNHCWIGQDCMLTKNANLCDEIVVSAHSVVTKSFDTPNTLIGGVPARVLRTGVGHSRLSPSRFGEFYDSSISKY